MKRTFYALCCLSILFVSCNRRNAGLSLSAAGAVESLGIQDANDAISGYDGTIEETEEENFDGDVDVSKKFVVPVYYSKGIPKKIDYDFTKMNFNMATGVLFDILVDPDTYCHKTIKIEGRFTTSVYEGVRHFGVYTTDMAGCCPAGLEFIPSSTTDFSINFPMEDASITVIGRMEFGFNGVDEQLFFMADEIRM